MVKRPLWKISKKKDRRDFWSEFVPDIDETRRRFPALEVSVLQKFLVARNRAKKQSAKIFSDKVTRWLLLNIVMFDIYVKFLGCMYVFLLFFPTGNSCFQVKPDKAAPEMNKIYRWFSIGWIREVHLTYKVWVRRTEPLKTVPHDYLALEADEIPCKPVAVVQGGIMFPFFMRI